MQLLPANIFEALAYGTIGLAAILAVLAFYLLALEQKRTSGIRKSMRQEILKFEIFCISLIVIGIAASVVEKTVDGKSSDSPNVIGSEHDRLVGTLAREISWRESQMRIAFEPVDSARNSVLRAMGRGEYDDVGEHLRIIESCYRSSASIFRDAVQAVDSDDRLQQGLHYSDARYREFSALDLAVMWQMLQSSQGMQRRGNLALLRDSPGVIWDAYLSMNPTRLEAFGSPRTKIKAIEALIENLKESGDNERHILYARITTLLNELMDPPGLQVFNLMRISEPVRIWLEQNPQA